MEWRKALMKNRIRIVKNLANPDDVADCLFTDGIFTEEMRDYAKQEPEMEKKTRTILDTLNRRGHRSITSLYNAFIETGNDELAALLFDYLFDIGDLATSEDFHKLLSNGTYESFENRVFLCGSCACGKSTLASVLIGSPIPLTWKSTDGLVIHFGCNGINLETYEMIPLKEEHKGHAVFTKVVIGHASFGDKSKQNTDALQDQVDRISSSKVSPDANTSTSEMTKATISSLPEIKKIESYAIHDDILKEIKSRQYITKIAPSDLVDFGGQRTYDMTHQLFVQHGGTFIIMFDGSRDFNESLPEYGTQNISNESIVKHWVNSILTYCVDDDDDDDVMPMILFAATHSDAVLEGKGTKKERKIEFVKTVTKMFGSHKMSKHIVFDPVFFINGTDKDDEEIQYLKRRLVTIARSQTSWGLRRPMIWVPLELQITNMKNNNIHMVPKSYLSEVNKMNGDLALSNRQLEDFLTAQHSLGKIMYFNQPELHDFIILHPPVLVNILRSFVTDEIFWPEDESLTYILRRMTETGKIYKSDLLKIWQQKEVSQYIPDDRLKKFIMQVLVHLDVLVLPKRYIGERGETINYFLVPCTVKGIMPMSFLNDKSFANRTLSLVYRLQNTSIPSALSFKLIGAVSGIWPIKEENGSPLLYHSSAVLCVDSQTDLRIIVEDTRIIVYLTHMSFKSFISPDIAASIQACLTLTLENVLKFYFSSLGKTHKNMDVSNLFQIEVGEVCNKSPCVVSISKAEQMPDWVCDNGITHSSRNSLLWFFNKKQGTCSLDLHCTGLDETILTASPSDKHLARLANQLSIKSLRELVLNLGLELKDWEDIEWMYQGSRPLICGIMALDFWKRKQIEGKPSKTFADLLNALRAIEENRHLLCKVFRENTQLLGIADVKLQEVPHDDVLKKLLQYLGNCALHLGIELGITVSSIEETMVAYQKNMYGQISDILRKWKELKEKPTIYRLMLALERVDMGGVNYLKKTYLEQ